MSKNAAKFILHKHGLGAFSIRELRDLLKDRFQPLPPDVKDAIKTLTAPTTEGTPWTK